MKRHKGALYPDENGEIRFSYNDLIELEEGDTVRTKAQQDFYQMKLRQTESQKDYGPFTWMLYNCGNEIFSNLRASTLTRLIYISTFLGYNGYLVNDNYTILTKEKLKRKINISNTDFYDFWNEIVSFNFIYEEDNKIIMNKNVFTKGELTKNIIKNYDVVRLAVNGVRALYENVDSVRSHKNLSYLFKIIPFVNKEWNIICKNPKEKNRELINYMSIPEFCVAIGYNKSNARKLINTLSMITFNGQPALIYITMDFKIEKAKIVINPNLYWAGTNWENVKYLSYWFNR